MAEVRNVVCDMCGASPAETYAIAKRPNTPWVVDLCEQHAAPIAEWREHGRQGGNRRVYRKYQKVRSTAL